MLLFTGSLKPTTTDETSWIVVSSVKSKKKKRKEKQTGGGGLGSRLYTYLGTSFLLVNCVHLELFSASCNTI